MGTAEAKGLNFIGCQAMIGRLFGTDTLLATQAALPPDLAERLRNRAIIAAGWYPVAWYDQLLAAAMARVPGGSLATLERLGNGLVEHDMQGIYRLLVKLITPQTLMSWGPRTFGHYYRGGTVQVVDSREGLVHVAYDGWEGFTERLWHSVAGGTCAALAACGAREVEGHVVALERQGVRCTMRMQWRR